jgi:hypothetical protein
MDLADRMKLHEDIGAGQRLIPNLPVCIRIDGKAFHSWTRGLRRPYDERLHTLFDYPVLAEDTSLSGCGARRPTTSGSGRCRSVAWRLVRVLLG